ncbi:HAMP domain-containing sensor histidine kinase [uncultured Pontibacter sp.]|uniref:sensor histidine kinase n=1 Tax=uncultured Pontibacter sp. TaxID=453356 RepID=UPI00261EE2AC|nr:HAMP domain-containing sensor histidine kinase [uncultured Pontibacter sp.]
MSKNVIIGVLVLMSISLLGVVGLQLYWINDAIQVKQAEFDRSVNEALARLVEKLETQEAASVVASQMATLQPDTITAEKTLAKTPQKEIAVTANPTESKAATLKPAARTLPATATYNTTGKPKASANTAQQTTVQSLTFKRDSNAPENSVHIFFNEPDTAKVRQATGKVTGFKTISAPATANRNIAYFQQIASTKVDSLTAAQLRRNAVYTLGQLADTSNFIRIDRGSVKFSVDTLRIISSKLDSLLKKTRHNSTGQAAGMASVSIKNDSIFISKGDNKRPIYVSTNAAPKHFNFTTTPAKYNKTYYRESFGTAAMQEAQVFAAKAPKAKDSLTAEKQPQKPAKLPNSKTNPSNISKIEVKKSKLNDVVQKMVVEYVVKDEPLTNRLNLQTLPVLLKTELENKGISMDFGYWVVSGKNDTVASHNLKPLKQTSQPKYKASLFPNDIFEKPDYLGVYFADSRVYALKSLWGMLSLSALFTLVIIATFGTTIHIIYKQKKLSEMKNDFINNMTHEFKTPIATISLATDSIANPKIYEHPEKIKYYTGIISQENKRMHAQVENVLQIAQLEKNDFKLNFKPVDVHLLIGKAIESIRLQVEERRGQVTIQLNALQHELSTDEVHLFNVICNLLDNANKYSPNNPDICLVTQNVDGGLLIAVEDKGMGMSKETQQRVFDKFYRVPTGNLHNVKGFGLGLSYVKAIVQAHKGNVHLKSEPGKGSRFEIFLPIC